MKNPITTPVSINLASSLNDSFKPMKVHVFSNLTKLPTLVYLGGGGIFRFSIFFAYNITFYNPCILRELNHLPSPTFYCVPPHFAQIMLAFHQCLVYSQMHELEQKLQYVVINSSTEIKPSSSIQSSFESLYQVRKRLIEITW